MIFKSFNFRIKVKTYIVNGEMYNANLSINVEFVGNNIIKNVEISPIYANFKYKFDNSPEYFWNFNLLNINKKEATKVGNIL